MTTFRTNYLFFRPTQFVKMLHKFYCFMKLFESIICSHTPCNVPYVLIFIDVFSNEPLDKFPLNLIVYNFQ